jgi:hypothetical protein
MGDLPRVKNARGNNDEKMDLPGVSGAGFYGRRLIE